MMTSFPAAHHTTLLDGLNPEQREAVTTTQGPLLVLAGAGTGKTRVLTTRLTYLIVSGTAVPGQTLTMTFTNKAAREMRERTLSLTGSVDASLHWLGTFHAISAKILRNHAKQVDLHQNFTILGKDDQINLCKQIVEAAKIDAQRWSPRLLAWQIDNWKNQALKPDQLDSTEDSKFADGKGIACYRAYQNRLKILNACDFGDLLLHNITLLQNNPDILTEYQRRFKYILVDEYQDTNVAQYLWLRLLAQGANNICCVGDDDQSIYGWRGAEVDNILRFEKDFPGAKIIRLERNYRSSEPILACASAIIANNKNRLGKTLFAATPPCDDPDAEKISVRGVWDGETEARMVADSIESRIAKGYRHDDCAILVRMSWQMRLFEECFILRGIPYRVIGGPRFFERAEIRDAMAYLRLLRSVDDDLAFERAVNQPKRGIGLTTLRKLHESARHNGRSLFAEAKASLAANDLKGTAKTGMTHFLGQVDLWRKQLADGIAHTKLTAIILDESGYISMLQKDRSVQAQTRLENLNELVNAMDSFPDLSVFLEHVELVMDTELAGDDNKVEILTLHGAKGLEWPQVFLPGWEEDVFPSRRNLDENGTRGLEEERRLAYVGITRAREACTISFSANRQVYGRWQSAPPSRFIDELSKAHIDSINDISGSFAPTHTSNMTDRHSRKHRSFGLLPEQMDKHNVTQPRRVDHIIRTVETTGKKIPGQFKFNQAVQHKKYGKGRVIDTNGTKLTVIFENGQQKKILSRYIKPI